MAKQTWTKEQIDALPPEERAQVRHDLKVEAAKIIVVMVICVIIIDRKSVV